MRRFLWAPALLLAGCGGNPPGIAEDSQPVETLVVLRGGEAAEVPGTPLRLSFLAVPADSRCPIDLVCAHAGEAIVEIAAADGSSFTKLLRLNLYQEPHAAEVAGYLVRLTRLEPDRRVGVPVPLGDYQAVLSVVMLVTG